MLNCSTKDESLRGVKMNYGDEFLLRSENYGDPTVSKRLTIQPRATTIGSVTASFVRKVMVGVTGLISHAPKLGLSSSHYSVYSMFIYSLHSKLLNMSYYKLIRSLNRIRYKVLSFSRYLVCKKTDFYKKIISLRSRHKNICSRHNKLASSPDFICHCNFLEIIRSISWLRSNLV